MPFNMWIIKQNKTKLVHPTPLGGEKEAQKRGDICICIADWLCYTAGETQHCKAIIPLLKKKELHHFWSGGIFLYLDCIIVIIPGGNIALQFHKMLYCGKLSK